MIRIYEWLCCAAGGLHVEDMVLANPGQVLTVDQAQQQLLKNVRRKRSRRRAALNLNSGSP